MALSGVVVSIKGGGRGKQEGKEEEVGFLYECLSASASRCHHLNAFGSSRSVRRVDLKCPLAKTRAHMHISVYKCVHVMPTRATEALRSQLFSYCQQSCMLRISFA